MSNTTVLFVDDEVQILSSLRRELYDSEFRCIFANSATEALEILDNQVIDVLVTDMKMPKMNGLELLKIAKEKFPTVVRMILSGYTHLPQVIAAINQGFIYKFIPKPWDFDKDLKPALDEAIKHRNYLINFFSADAQTTVQKDHNSEIESFKKILDYMGKTLRYLLQQELSNGTRDNIITIFNMYHDTYIKYIDTLAYQESSFRLEMLIENVNNQTNSSNHKSYCLELPKNYDNHKSYSGNMKLISGITTLVLDNLKNYSINGNISPKLNIEEAVNLEIMSLFLSFPLKKGDVIDIKNDKIRKQLNILSLLLQKISELVKATLVISVIQSSVYAKLDIPLIKYDN